MRWYWAKIVLGAVVVFAAGYGAVRLVQGGIARGRSVFATSDPITIPLAFIPFTVDGRDVGTFRRVTIRRDAPKVVAGIDLRVSLQEALSGREFAACRITTVEQGRFDIHRGFSCLAADRVDSALVAFGTVRFLGPHGTTEVTVPLLLDSAVVGEIRRSEQGVSVTQQAISVEEGEAARVRAEKAAADARRRADSIAARLRSRTP